MSSRLWHILVFALASAFAAASTCAYAAETRTGDFLSGAEEMRAESEPQVAEPHLASTVFDYETASGYALAAESGGEEIVAVYRGVNNESPAFADALNGAANPRGTVLDPIAHNAGQTATSGYTSWTTDLIHQADGPVD